MFHVSNKYRERFNKSLASNDSIGNNGFFVIPHPRIVDYEIYVQASDGEGWEHVSVSVSRKKHKQSRCPTWEEMCFVKDLFWDKQDTVIQYHPPESDYVNMHPFVLHLWRPTGFEIPVPDSILIGIKT